MALTTLCFVGDSLTAGTKGGFSQASGGPGNFVDQVSQRLANIPGIGPLLSGGLRGVWLGLIGSVATSDWTFTGAWTAVTSTDAFDKAPYGAVSPAVTQYGNGSGLVATWTKSRILRPVVGFAIYWVDYTSGGNWSYRVDGGAWTAMGQTLANDNKLCKFYVNTPIVSTVDIRCANAAGTGVGCLPVGIEPVYSTATDGLIVHNVAVNGSKLNQLCATTSGDRMAFFDSVKLGTGSPLSPTPNAGVIVMHINDVALNNTTTWNTDITTFNTRMSPLGTVGIMSPWEADYTAFNIQNQTSYRAQTKTSARTLGMKTLDHFDRWQAMGFGDASGTDLVGTGSNLVDVSTFAGAGVLILNDGSTLPSSGWLQITSAGANPLIRYSSKSGAQFFGCKTIQNPTTISQAENVSFGQSVNIQSGGSGNFLMDLAHENQNGHNNIADAVYWFVRNNFLNIKATPSTYPIIGTKAAVAYKGSRTAPAYVSGNPIGIS